MNGIEPSAPHGPSVPEPVLMSRGDARPDPFAVGAAAPLRSAELFAGPGACCGALRAVDWAATPLGAVAEWPMDLACAARVTTLMPTPMLVWWGEDFHQLHNDAVLAAQGDDQPAVGRPANQCWSQPWEVLGPSAIAVLDGGEIVHLDDVVLPTNIASTMHWTLSLGPLRDDAGRVAGVLCSAVDLTARVTAYEQERRAAEEMTANLQLALGSNRRIGTAIGVLMARRRITDDAAFELLRASSQRDHRKLRDIAEEVMLTGDLPD